MTKENESEVLQTLYGNAPEPSGKCRFAVGDSVRVSRAKITFEKGYEGYQCFGIAGDWELALTEFIYPHTWNNVTSENILIVFDVSAGKELGRSLPPGLYATVPETLKAITLKNIRTKCLKF